ncbi:MAG: hypothetical protein UX38_C0001G0059 [Microgenomates group bacterium GW2011_GWC1_46_16]|uniref:Uncharacterized protein n=2 Tax=Candidatus Collieribacteriota TaxID=1752725 RepID=A0A1F5FXX9_9BACT|nr:MAG: hypothetical protein UX38_C0001G0059 [Microgenomates group bacterium GW2011_GWC1_46_16]KKU27899.1 MAG: hypothetical protein UX40_C0005G0052 [Microgenomates group bacterium GW2011_GWF2_46_18]KKU44301.1 MAG: hypothetical protein UX59_C0001G0020 [Microgenomates group bacterium GW2011_GWA1_46_7]KKU60920.1 MAG: hypothetical protein UX82_C0006G0006 [Microgenomates group bacterium GW2011_GWE1_47_12]OGD70932.1 MAG: hypothetical protein A2187_02715 [Candidatus Collierbacteria bacterium RIFOXYA1_
MNKLFHHFLIFSIVSILTWVALPTPSAKAVGNSCYSLGWATICRPDYPTQCNFNKSDGTAVKSCCGTADLCAAYKASLAESGETFSATGTCGLGAIDTALGCIPYTFEAFTPALFGFLAGLAGGIALIIMLIATVQIMVSGDNAEAVKKGKELFTGAVTGLLFIIFSVTLLRLVAGDIIKLPGF